MAWREQDPFLSYRFRVEIDGLIVGGFSDVSGLDIEIELQTYNEGGMNDYVHNFPKGIKHPRLVFKRGMSRSFDFMAWFSNCAKGNITRKSGAVILLDAEGKDVRRWSFLNAYPVKCVGPAFKSIGNDVALETFELIHEGINVTSG